jgi:G:T-mismatch repair DNA endonuclease (very short patch repair protein)
MKSANLDAFRRKCAANMSERIQNGDITPVSKFERETADVMRRLGFNIETSVGIRQANGRFVAVFDITIPDRRIAIECHGSFWHGGRWSWERPTKAQARNLAYEERKRVLAINLGLDLRVLWEHQFHEDPIGACLTVCR